MPRTVNPSDFQSKRKEVPDNEYARTIPCNTVNLSAPFHWLALGLHDFVRMPLISAFYGICFMAAAIGIVLGAMARHTLSGDAKPHCLYAHRSVFSTGSL